MNTETLEMVDTNELVNEAMGAEAQVEETNATQQEQRLVPEMITTADMAIRVLIAATDTAFKNNVFKEMNDVACIDKSVKMCAEFVQNEIFKIRNYNKILVETTSEEGKIEFNEYAAEFTETGAPGVTVATVVPAEGQTTFMFYNDGAVLLNGDKVYNVHGRLVPSVTVESAE